MPDTNEIKSTSTYDPVHTIFSFGNIFFYFT